MKVHILRYLWKAGSRGGQDPMSRLGLYGLLLDQFEGVEIRGPTCRLLFPRSCSEGQ